MCGLYRRMKRPLSEESLRKPALAPRPRDHDRVGIRPNVQQCSNYIYERIIPREHPGHCAQDNLQDPLSSHAAGFVPRI